ncbi:U4/U6.U5 small nuclear ribonucleoprotein [Clonorchis sinensis]|uniref:U4/U6.U5 small nuclear ribonucleoprotein 27 kDa protein n=1 Tax=Clonorchis sinensis TaxID=79923 RepID=A0A8T1MG43_CLOSI|nr:U4/U6.U5 small nuclear ribonucleoprotein [Clonorchis sinensis]
MPRDRERRPRSRSRERPRERKHGHREDLYLEREDAYRRDRDYDFDREDRHRRDRERDRERRRRHERRDPDRYRSRSRSPQLPQPRSRSSSPRQIADELEETNINPATNGTDENMTEEQKEMMRIMGFCDFDSTKGKHVIGNSVYVANITKQRKYRQYMNRRGGFNRPLDPVA